MKNLVKNVRRNWLRNSVAALVFVGTLFNVTLNAEVDEATNTLQLLSLGIREAVSDETYDANLYKFENCTKPDGGAGGQCLYWGGNCGPLPVPCS